MNSPGSRLSLDLAPKVELTNAQGFLKPRFWGSQNRLWAKGAAALSPS